ncbi:hypothetical protein RhiirA1_419024 [Rhizophagus irregularis]|uniref:Uncharacterized protein n=1 Tax=Rhizophagus irregularis TaxID=588596 RepID=A0A2I1GG10_9GLOM|nr:hypothetical protein RhiirA1_419024 [Rhizophagus irregularis]PKY20754.1 hypothetical protein RhiirB3_408682 [Rhizophagus irregularis]PKY45563.1 hypothetical protein RhiirA4_401371 [Rhizophagus irregularis]
MCLSLQPFVLSLFLLLLLLFFHLCGYFGEGMLIHIITNRYLSAYSSGQGIRKL